jgi:dihydrofolate synthase/folylpolyglutamate synthase
MLANQQGPEILQALLAPGDRAWIVPVPGHPSWTCEHLAGQLAAQRSLPAQPSLAEALRPAPDLEQGLAAAVAAAMPDRDGGGLPAPRPVVVAGSLYLIGHLLAAQS